MMTFNDDNDISKDVGTNTGRQRETVKRCINIFYIYSKYSKMVM